MVCAKAQRAEAAGDGDAIVNLVCGDAFSEHFLSLL